MESNSADVSAKGEGESSFSICTMSLTAAVDVTELLLKVCRWWNILKKG